MTLDEARDSLMAMDGILAHNAKGTSFCARRAEKYCVDISIYNDRGIDRINVDTGVWFDLRLETVKSLKVCPFAEGKGLEIETYNGSVFGIENLTPAPDWCY